MFAMILIGDKILMYFLSLFGKKLNVEGSTPLFNVFLELSANLFVTQNANRSISVFL